MNLRTTLALVVLVAAGAIYLNAGAKLPQKVDPAPALPSIVDLGTRGDLESLNAKALQRIEVRRADATMVLEKKGDAWALPGGWPTRPVEVDELVALLGGLRSRFVSEPADDLAAFGLDKPSITVRIDTDRHKHVLEFGQPKESIDNRFSRPTYLRMDGRAEAVRLGPGVLAALDRPSDYYQQRRLFPVERVVKEDNKQEKVERLAATALTVEDKKPEGPRFTIANSGGAWELSAPVRDRLEPRSRDALLAAVPDIWAERFLTADPAATGLATPERIVTVTRADGTPVALLVGKVSSTRSKKVMRQPPPGVPAPPREETVQEEYRYAKLQGNEQVFEVNGDKLKDVFVAVDTLRDPQVARFKVEDARKLEITQRGQVIELAKAGDQWKLVKPLQTEADAAKVTELLTKLSGLEARDKDLIDNAKPEQYGLDKPVTIVNVTVEEEPNAGDATTKQARTLAIKIGKQDATTKKLYVQTDGWPRVNAVDDSLLSLAVRPALAYRGKRILDFASTDLEAISIRRGTQTIALQRDKGSWKLSAPLQAEMDAGKASGLVAALAALEALEFVADAPSAEELEKQYGLGASAIAATLTFTDKAKPPRTVLVGKSRGMKPGFFAKLADAPAVFVVGNETQGLLDRDVLALLPLQLWQLPPADMAAIGVQKEGQAAYQIATKEGDYRIAGPFDAPVVAATAQGMTNELAAPAFSSLVVAEAKDLKEYGLDKPALKLTVTDKAGKTHALSIGKAAPGGRYAKTDERAAVGILSDKIVQAVDRGPLDLLDPVVLSLDATKADRIQLQSGDSRVTLDRKGEVWRVLDTPASPFDADSEAVASLTGVLLNLRADRLAAYGPKVEWQKFGLDKPFARIQVRLPKMDDKPELEHTIELGAAPEGVPGGRYARVDKGPAVAVLGPKAVQELTKTYLDFVSRRVLQVDVSAVVQMLRQQGAQPLELTKRDDGWHLTKPTDARADARAVQDLLFELGDLRARRVVAFPAKDVKEFGLDAPEAVFQIKLKADSKPAEHVLKIGKVSDAMSGDRYAMTGTGAAVAVLPGALVKRLLAPPLAFRDRALARFADADKVRLERGPRRAAFARVDGTWKLTEPLMADAVQEEIDEFVGALAKLRADELVAEKPTADELKVMGLDKPETQWRLLAGDKEVLHLLVGGREKSGARAYAKLADRDLVFLLDPQLTTRALGEFRMRTIWATPPDAVQMESLRFTSPTGAFALEKVGDAWQVVGKADAKINKETIDETLSTLAGVKLLRYAADKGADLKLFGLEPPELAIEVATRSGKRVLHLGRTEGESKRRYARIPEDGTQAVFVLDEGDSTRLVRDLAAFTRK